MIVWAVCLYRRPPFTHPSAGGDVAPEAAVAPTAGAVAPGAPADSADSAGTDSGTAVAEAVAATSPKELPQQRVTSTNFSDIDPHTMAADHPFRREAAKLLSGRLEETDSMSRHKILSYCEHLRTSYTTRDIDFIRQVFSDDALIIVGHVVKTSEAAGAVTGSSRVVYSRRSKKDYVARLDGIFKSGKKIDVEFSDFKIMRHPTMEGIYGVTLRQKYTAGSYSDDGYLFLLWDFRNKSMPLIHVRTWQPSLSDNPDQDDIIGIGDFNLE